MTMMTATENRTSGGNRCYTISDLMSMLGVGRKSIMTLLNRKEFPWFTIGSNQYRIPKVPFDTWLYGEKPEQ